MIWHRRTTSVLPSPWDSAPRNPLHFPVIRDSKETLITNRSAVRGGGSSRTLLQKRSLSAFQSCSSPPPTHQWSDLVVFLRHARVPNCTPLLPTLADFRHTGQCVDSRCSSILLMAPVRPGVHKAGNGEASSSSLTEDVALSSHRRSRSGPDRPLF